MSRIVTNLGWTTSPGRGESWPRPSFGFAAGKLRRAMALVIQSWLLLSSASAAESSDKVDFNFQIRPLLSDRCFACHGPDEKARKGKLRLDTKEGAFKALDDGWSVIKPGDPARSELVRRIFSTDPEEVMPPPDSNLQLT